MKLEEIFLDKNFKKNLFSFRTGLEKENIRSDAYSKLARTNHPEQLNVLKDYITKDFGEALIECITPPFASIDKLFAFLEMEEFIVHKALPEGEYLWPDSMPPILPHREELIELGKLDDEHETEYREYLAEKYGRRKQMMTGIHINFSFDDGFFDSLREYYPEKSMIVLKNDIYLKLARNYLHFYWLIVYLFGATPKTSSGFYENETLTATPVRSIHNSSKGYENSYDVKVRFGSIDEYVKDLQKNIAQGRLRSEREFYNPVRLRRGEKAYELQLKGVQYLEFRGYDLNPFDENGITREGLRFIHLFLLYILTLDIEDFDLEMAAIKRAKVAMEPPNSKTAYFMEAIEFFEGMEAFYTKMNVKNQDKKILSKFKRMIQLPEETLSAKMLTYARMDADYLMRLAKEHKEKFLKLSRLFEMNEFPHHKELNEFIKKKFQSEKGEVKHEKMGKE